MSESKKRLVPVRRFKEFENADTWEQRKLGETASLRGRIGFRGYKQTDLVAKGNGAITLSPSDIDENGNISFENNKYISWDKFEESPEIQVNVGDILFTKTASIGKIGFVSQLPEKATINPQIALVTPFPKELGYFIFLSLRLDEFTKKVRNITGGSSVPTISQEKLKELTFKVPNTDEQQKISIFFKKVDSLITLHQRKLDKLKRVKSAYLAEMFPAEGEREPKRRFPGFTGAWEQRKLGEVATFINGRAYKQNELLDSGKYKVLRVGNFYTNDSWYYSNLELADKYYIDKGDLVYTWSATFGPHIWDGEKVIYHYHIWKIELSESLDRDFTLQILEADKAKLLANTNGSTMIHVTKKDMESKVISLPNIEEQKQIGSYLMKFDSLIALHQRKLDKLKKMKAAYLNEMFV